MTNNDETIRKMNEMGLQSMADAFKAQLSVSIFTDLCFSERVEMLIDQQYQTNYNHRIAGIINQAKLRYPAASIETIAYTGRNLDKALIRELATCNYIANSQNIIIQGATGSGKTWLACSFGKQSCVKEYRTKYIRLPDLLVQYDEASVIGKSMKFLTKYSKYSLLIIDEWLLNDLSNIEQQFILEIMERRYDNVSTIFCSQYKIEGWHERLGSGIMADAIMDRIVHNAFKIESGSVNMRELTGKK